MRQNPPPILVLGLGNVLLQDDGVGPALLGLLETLHGKDDRVEFVDGGTQGLALLGYLSERQAVLILDAVALGAEPGSVHVREDTEVLNLGTARASTAHEGNAGELLRVAVLLGDLPDHVVLVGVEPKTIRTGVGLSSDVKASLPIALSEARARLQQIAARTPLAAAS
jgi:hydrogenase maturation protease